MTHDLWLARTWSQSRTAHFIMWKTSTSNRIQSSSVWEASLWLLQSVHTHDCEPWYQCNQCLAEWADLDVMDISWICVKIFKSASYFLASHSNLNKKWYIFGLIRTRTTSISLQSQAIIKGTEALALCMLIGVIRMVGTLPQLHAIMAVLIWVNMDCHSPISQSAWRSVDRHHNLKGFLS